MNIVYRWFPGYPLNEPVPILPQSVITSGIVLQKILLRWFLRGFCLKYSAAVIFPLKPFILTAPISRQTQISKNDRTRLRRRKRKIWQYGSGIIRVGQPQHVLRNMCRTF